MLFTFWFVCFCWIFFRAESFGDALEVTRAFVLLDAPGDRSPDSAWWVVVALVAATHLLVRIAPRPSRRLPDWAFGFAYGFAIAVVLLFVPTDARPFIYFQF